MFSYYSKKFKIFKVLENIPENIHKAKQRFELVKNPKNYPKSMYIFF